MSRPSSPLRVGRSHSIVGTEVGCSSGQRGSHAPTLDFRGDFRDLSRRGGIRSTVAPGYASANRALAATFSERYNKQDAGALANMFTKDAVRVTSGNSAPSVGPQAIEKIFKTQFESGFRHIDLEIDQVSPFGTDAAITVGRYEITGRGQDGPLKVDGRWTEVEVREGGVWKIRHSTVVPKIEPNPIIPRMEANSITPRTEGIRLALA